MDITIVIPTYNRKDLLTSLVNSLREQTFPRDRFEILIISDGCTDGTDEEFSSVSGYPTVRLVRQEKRGFGLARARNLGTKLAAGEIVLFIDDDMVADADLIKVHQETHTQFDGDVAVCGRVKLPPELETSPFSRLILGDICNLFLDKPDNPDFLPFEVALSWQTSFKRSHLIDIEGYDEEFQSYGWEDIEFSYRASQKGMRFYYQPEAITYHYDQRNSLQAHAQRLENSARMAPILFNKHPAIKNSITMFADKEPIDWRQDKPLTILGKAYNQILANQTLSSFLEHATPFIETRIKNTSILRRWYYQILSIYTLRGYQNGVLMLQETRNSP